MCFEQAYEADFGWESVAGPSLGGIALDGDGSEDTREAGFCNSGRNEYKSYDTKNVLNFNYLLTHSSVLSSTSS